MAVAVANRNKIKISLLDFYKLRQGAYFISHPPKQMLNFRIIFNLVGKL